MIDARENGVKFSFKKIVNGEGVEFEGTLSHDEADFVMQTGFITLLGAGAFALKDTPHDLQAPSTESVN